MMKASDQAGLSALDRPNSYIGRTVPRPNLNRLLEGRAQFVTAVVAKTRALAEDAAELIGVEYEPLAPVVDPETALDPGTPVIHAELGDNLAFERKLDAGEVDRAFQDADTVVEAVFQFGRHTGVTLEPRAVVADWNPGEARL